MAIELKPCPFCGGKAVFEVISNAASSGIARWDITIGCQNCGVKIPKVGYVEVALNQNGELMFPYKDDRGEVAKSWNERK